MSIVENIIDIPMEHEKNVFGQFDAYLKKIERTLQVTMVNRDGALKIIGPEPMVVRARSVFGNLIELSRRNERNCMLLDFRCRPGRIYNHKPKRNDT